MNPTYTDPVKAISSRLQIEFIAFGYASVFACAMYSWYERHLAELRYPIDSQGGMWAAGDEMLAYYIFFLFLVPTFFLLRLMGTSERTYTSYSKFALALALTSPLSALLLLVNVSRLSPAISDIALMRLFRSPMMFIFLATSRVFARPKIAKRLINLAIVTEVLTVIAGVAGALIISRFHS